MSHLHSPDRHVRYLFTSAIIMACLMCCAAAPVYADCGTPRFLNPTDHLTERHVPGIVAGDFNNDGNEDLAAANFNNVSPYDNQSNSISLLLGNGAGGFATAVHFPAGLAPYHLVAGDFNNDGKLDLVAASRCCDPHFVTLSILLGNGMGGFATPANIPFGTTNEGSYAADIEVGHFNADSNLDLVVVYDNWMNPSTNPGRIAILLGNGAGGFGARTDFSGNYVELNDSVVADFNGDSKPDIAVSDSDRFASPQPTFNVSILLGNGTGGLGAPASFAVGLTTTLATGDFNGDGKADVLAEQGSLSLLLGNGAGSFTKKTSTLSGLGNGLAVGDFNNDGRADALVSRNNGTDYLFLGHATNGFGRVLTLPDFGSFEKGAVADFNEDGKPDIAIGYINKIGVKVGLNTCARIVPVSDYDGDAIPDYAVWRPGNGNWYVLQSLNNSVISRTWGLGSMGDVPVPGDYDGDAKTDHAVFRPSEGNWYVLKSSDGSYFTTNWGLSEDKPVPGDYDGDGKTDIAVWRPSTGIFYVLNSSNGSYTAQPWGHQSFGDIPVPRDYDGDGHADFAVFRPSEGTWYVLRSSDNSYQSQQWGISTDTLVPFDYDGDGHTDFAVWRPSTGIFYVLNSSNGSFTAQQFGNGSFGDVPAAADYTVDGKAEFTVWRSSNTTWYSLRYGSGGFAYAAAQQFGSSGDIPLPESYRP